MYVFSFLLFTNVRIVFPYRYRVNGPRTTIAADRNPGQCWPMAGSKGHVLVKLSHTILVTGFTLEHIARKSSPTNSIASAPKDFSVEVFRDFDSYRRLRGIKVGQLRYDENGTNPDQFFELKPGQRKVASFVRLNVDSNYGHPQYTCLYRFRVHGIYHAG